MNSAITQLSYQSEFTDSLTQEIFENWEKEIPNPSKEKPVLYEILWTKFLKRHKRRNLIFWPIFNIVAFCPAVTATLCFLLSSAQNVSGEVKWPGAWDYLYLFIFAGIISGFVMNALVFHVKKHYGEAVEDYDRLHREWDFEAQSIDADKQKIEARQTKFLSDDFFKIQATADFYQDRKIPELRNELTDLQREIKEHTAAKELELKNDLVMLENFTSQNASSLAPDELHKLYLGKEAIRRELSNPEQSFIELIESVKAKEKRMNVLESVQLEMRSYCQSKISVLEIDSTLDKYLAGSSYPGLSVPNEQWTQFIAKLEAVGEKIEDATRQGMETLDTSRQLTAGVSPVNLLISSNA